MCKEIHFKNKTGLLNYLSTLVCHPRSRVTEENRVGYNSLRDLGVDASPSSVLSPTLLRGRASLAGKATFWLPPIARRNFSWLLAPCPFPLGTEAGGRLKRRNNHRVSPGLAMKLETSSHLNIVPLVSRSWDYKDVDTTMGTGLAPTLGSVPSVAMVPYLLWVPLSLLVKGNYWTRCLLPVSF